MATAETEDYYDDAQKITESPGNRTDDKFLQHLFPDGSFRSGAGPSCRRTASPADTAGPPGT